MIYDDKWDELYELSVTIQFYTSIKWNSLYKPSMNISLYSGQIKQRTDFSTINQLGLCSNENKYCSSIITSACSSLI
uniref:Putative ovule protein n=1 Tax=Solanum chacoense TaxID=4108 RepID=A0A0V0H165_SOLCH